MGVVSAIVAAVAKITIGAVVKFVAGTILSIGVSRLMAKRAMKKANAGGDGGARIQLPPATDNKLPVVYGSAFVSGPITDAKLSTDQKTMWYVVALAEHSDDQGGGGGSYTFDTNNIYYDGKKVNFVGGTAQVASLAVNNQGTTQIDTRVNGKLFIYLFTNGSSSGVNTGGQSAITILQDSQIPAGQRWTANHTMTNTCFAIVKVIYNTDAGTTNLGAIACKITNSLTKPGECLKDYMLNTRYGAAIPLARIDTDSLDDLDTYSDQNITYVPVGGGSATQARYRINGPLDTANDCLTNLQILVDACDSWLQYSELSGKWKVVINKPYDAAPNAETLNDLFLVDSSNLVGGITINPVDLNETYNEVEVAYPNKNIKDQTDFQVLELEDYQATLLSPNEAINRLNVQLPVVNEAVQAKYLAVRRLLQSREDLIIVFRTDYSGIQVLAGDVIRVTHPVYGWTNKLFRVSNVAEEKYSDGSLGAQLVAFEYNGTIYNDNAIQDYVPAFNTGLTDPNIISQPGTPTVVLNPDTDGQVKSFKVTSAVPEEGSVLYMDFNYGNTSNAEQHQLYRMVQAAGGIPFTNSGNIAGNVSVNNISIDINDLPTGNYYFSTTARNDFSGRLSNSSAIFNWEGANLNPNTVPGNTIIGNTLPGNTIIDGTITNTQIGSNTIVANNIQTGTILGNNIAANTIIGNNITIGTLTGNLISNNTITINNFASSLNINERIGGNNWSVYLGNPQGNLSPVLFPVDATANTVRNIPIFWTGTTINANNIFPYLFGTSVVVPGTDGNNYYAANSTGSFTPAAASVLLINDNEDGWFKVLEDTFSAGTLADNQALFNDSAFTIYTGANTTYQVVQGVRFGNNAYYDCPTNLMDTIFVNRSNAPMSWARVQVTISNNASNITGAATFARNISNTTIVVISGSIQTLKGIPPFF